MSNNTELDSLWVSELSERYGITRSNVYNRLNKIGIQPEKIGGKAFLSADQLAQMDALDGHLKQGKTFEDFLVDRRYANIPTGQIEKSYRNGRTTGNSENSAQLANSQPSALAVDALADAIALKLAAIAPAPSAPMEPLANLRLLQEAFFSGWHLSTSQLAPLLGLKSLSGRELRRYGFIFRRVGKNGSESAWKIIKEESESDS